MSDTTDSVDRDDHDREEIVLRNMDQTTARNVIDDLTELGIKREAIRVEK